MRLAIKLLLVVAILVVVGAGLLPPLFARAALSTDALNAARAASSVAASGNSAQVNAAAARSVATHAGVHLDSVHVVPEGTGSCLAIGPCVMVTVSETVHTFMHGLPGLESWFRVSSTQESQLGQ